MSVIDFLRRHENEPGPAGEFVRSCLLVAELAEWMPRDELRDSVQLEYLLNCFPMSDDER